MEMKEKENEILEEVAVNEEVIDVVDLEKEAKKAKIMTIAKKVGKIAGVVLVGVLGSTIGYAIGKNSVAIDSENVEVDLETEIIDAE